LAKLDAVRVKNEKTVHGEVGLMGHRWRVAKWRPIVRTLLGEEEELE